MSRKLIGLAISVAALLFALLAWRAFSASNIGNALIFAGGAIAVAMIRVSHFPSELLRKPLTEVAEHAVRNPASLAFRIGIAVSWLLILGGISSFFI